MMEKGITKLILIMMSKRHLIILRGNPLLLEKFIPFEMEVSVISARNTKGQIKSYPLVENIHEKNILRQTIAPARVSKQIIDEADQIAEKIMSVLKGAGIFGIEMFVTNEDHILINEIAPRVHNSGHHTLQSGKTSQFEQHLRAILGLIGVPTWYVGDLQSDWEDFFPEYKKIDFSKKNIFLKMYEKKISKPLRKLGHLNLVGSDKQTIDELLIELSHYQR